MGTKLGVAFAIATLGWVLAPGQERWSAPGRMNTGHEDLSCDSCHRRAPGTLRQQIQANVRYGLGLRGVPADFGQKAVENADCLACHERPFDRHPVSRFYEPRFERARRELAPEQCESCHREHSGARVTVEASYCVQCHADLALEQDPLDVPHATLIARGRWSSCLGCHDFHGNHLMRVPTQLGDAAAAASIADYFEGGASPYPAELRRPAARRRSGGTNE